MVFKFNKNSSFNFIIGVLLISLLMNIYLSIMNDRYKYKIGKENHNNLVELKVRNESALNIIKQCLKSESINSQELFALHETYSHITDSYNKLWLSYNDYEKEKLLSISFSKSKENILESNLVYSRIEDLLYKYINNKFDDSLDVMDLKGQVLHNFVIMEALAMEVNDYYSKEKDDGITDEKKEFKLIKENYWVNSLKDISSIMEKYSDEEFIALE